MWKTTLVLGLAAAAALSACRAGKQSTTHATETAAAPTGVVEHGKPPNCNGESPVWVIEGAKVYLVPGDRLYGKTKRGQYLCLSQAQAEGYTPARRPFHHHHHKREKLFSV